MEQSNQEIVQKLSLPIKTKIAAWWIIVYVIVFSICKFFDIYFFHKTHKIPEGVVIMGYPSLSETLVIIILAVLFYSLISLFLLRKKKIAWYCAVVIFSYFLIGNFFRLFMIIFQGIPISLYELSLNFNFLLMLIPVTLLILDRKNFFKIAS